jgi:hypothetical protein
VSGTTRHDTRERRTVAPMKFDHVQHERHLLERLVSVLFPSLVLINTHPTFRATHPSKKNANENVAASNGACSDSVRSL